MSLLTVPPHIEAAIRDDGADVFGALTAESIRNSGFSGAAAEKHDASEGQNAPGPDGSGGSKTIVFCVFSCRRRLARTEKPCSSDIDWQYIL